MLLNWSLTGFIRCPIFRWWFIGWKISGNGVGSDHSKGPKWELPSIYRFHMNGNTMGWRGVLGEHLLRLVITARSTKSVELAHVLIAVKTSRKVTVCWWTSPQPPDAYEIQTRRLRDSVRCVLHQVFPKESATLFRLQKMLREMTGGRTGWASVKDEDTVWDHMRVQGTRA